MRVCVSLCEGVCVFLGVCIYMYMSVRVHPTFFLDVLDRLAQIHARYQVYLQLYQCQ